MALAKYTLSHTNNNPDTVAAAPTTSESIVAPDDNTCLVVIVGATPSTVTIVAPGTDNTGEARPDKVIVVGASSRRMIRVDHNYKDPATGAAAITFSSVATVTAYELRTK